ncbi:hypothetical protein Agub_g4469 [Astrephomene gubernaculifera]|uniref:ABC transporter domain-containing protein n=1 Tax=Astrephomene gubernaculifera TaxID=47775 RepID=A0AAD3DMW3_9CHLO|nr:hypothetical protein Agub_g4469 [Astrephomene gubernaculifera]
MASHVNLQANALRPTTSGAPSALTPWPAPRTAAHVPQATASPTSAMGGRSCLLVSSNNLQPARASQPVTSFGAVKQDRRRHATCLTSAVPRNAAVRTATAAAAATATTSSAVTMGFSSTGSYGSSLDEQDGGIMDSEDDLESPLEFPVPRGDTAGATLVLEGVTLQAGDRDLLTDVSYRLLPGQRAGLVGANGCGKSSLLRLLAGLRGAQAGRVLVAPGVQVGYLEQTAVGGSRRSVWQEARSRMVGLRAAERDMRRAERELEAGDPSAATRLAAAQERWEAAGGPSADRTISQVLGGLGFAPGQFHRPCSEFSGGWQMRIALARLLLGPAGQGAGGGGSLLLLDEPTNHLDRSACQWLSSHLSFGLPPSASLLLVSHDEGLLQAVCERVVEVRGGRLHAYVGRYDSFLRQRTEREAQARAEAAAQQAEIDRLEAFVTRFGAKASKASQAQSKAKLLEKLKASQTQPPAPAAAAGAGDARKVSLRLPRAPPCHQQAIKLVGAALGWGQPPAAAAGTAAGPGSAATVSQQPQEGQQQQQGQGQGEEGVEARRPLLSGLDLVIQRGQRILVLGPNGAGKSTLLRALAGSLPLWAGSRVVGEGVRLGVFSQDLAQDLPQDVPALEYVEGVARANDPGVTLERCRQALGALGLTGSMALQKIGVLSGGEKARVALASLSLLPANVLLLDEASNHLDAQTIEVLTGALRDFQGALVAITHNQAFATSLHATHILRVSGGTARLEPNTGLVAADFEHTPHTASASSSSAARSSGAAAGAGGGKKGKSSNGAAAAASAVAPAVTAAAVATAPAAPAAATPSAAAPAAAAPAAAAKPKAKRTTLAYKEQLEYKRLAKEMEVLGGKRAQLEAKLAAAASGSYSEVEGLSLELAKVAEELEAKELRWLELAEIAGDI